jgi:hypothetical protein
MPVRPEEVRVIFFMSLISMKIPVPCFFGESCGRADFPPEKNAWQAKFHSRPGATVAFHPHSAVPKHLPSAGPAGLSRGRFQIAGTRGYPEIFPSGFRGS